MSWPRPIAKMTEYQRFFKQDSSRSVMYLKDLRKRLESSLPNCSQKTATKAEELTKQYQDLFQLRYGIKEQSLRTATVVNQHRNTSKNTSASMQKKALVTFRIQKCTADTYCITNISAVRVDDSNDKNAVETSKHEINKFVDARKIEKEVSKNKGKQTDEINKPTEGVSHSTDINYEEKIKVEKRKITVAEYFARKRQENEIKMRQVNENAMKRKREVSENHERDDNENCSNDSTEMLDTRDCVEIAHKKAKFSATCKW